MIGDAIAHAIWMAMVTVAVVAVAVTLTLVYGLPILWGWVKPWIHMLTA